MKLSEAKALIQLEIFKLELRLLELFFDDQDYSLVIKQIDLLQQLADDVSSIC